MTHALAKTMSGCSSERRKKGGKHTFKTLTGAEALLKTMSGCSSITEDAFRVTCPCLGLVLGFSLEA